MRSLGQVARERDAREELLESAVDERLPALSTGELSEVEAAALRQAADSSTAARRAYDAFRPLDDTARSRIVDRLREELESPPAAGAEVVPMPSRIRRWRWAVAAAAALIAFAVIWPRAELTPMPQYELSLEGGRATIRSPNTGALPIFEQGSPFSLVLRPITGVKGQVAVRAFLDDGESVQVWPVKPRISESGSVLFAGTVGEDIPLPVGDGMLWIAVGRRGDLPDVARIRAIRDDPGAARSTRAWVLSNTTIRVNKKR